MLKWFQFDRRILKHFEFIIIIQLLPLFAISSWLIFEINPSLFAKQMLYYVVAFIVFVIGFLIPWTRLRWIIPFIYGFNLFLLLSTKIFGKSVLGAKRWLEIPGTGLTIQPSEFMKVSVLLMLAYIIAKNPPPREGYDLKMFAKLSATILLPFILIAIEPDLGTASVLLLTSFGVLFVIGIQWRIWATILILIAVISPFGYEYGLKDYQKQRIVNFVGEPSYHVKQSLIAIGSGSMFGQPKEEATQTQLKFLPISSTDFIFGYLGERFGFAGTLTVILLYAFLILNLISIAQQAVDNYYIQVMASGIGFLFFIYMGINISMTIGLAPVVGVPLPMFSHGGTSFIIFAFLLGILQHLLAFRFYFLYNCDSRIDSII
ncbi:MAG: rod shape-determining protein RodA [Epsilonproteobacteria bacterium]|nr:rod shape-determining protein RodA [Campylobacterota bacterium]